ncbi:hypothetical protein Rsl_1407 [Rickettsia slovaca 13-B]|uniref:Uncharacterized protein n=1 Tax=Rickettsia slovaca (strain 13-B) TaxID=941638 RepID=A0ABN4ABI4_RICS1|nr:hypothetical protein Rsl_1407 [Rickettsia slovaca 13-B]
MFEKSTFWDKVILMSFQGFFPSLRGARSDAAILSNFLRLPRSSTAARNDDVYST